MDRKGETAPEISGRTDSDGSTVRCLAAKNVVEHHFSKMTFAEAFPKTKEIGVCGLENGVMGWIKTNKDRAAGAAKTRGSGHQDAPEPPTEREEPQDVGL